MKILTVGGGSGGHVTPVVAVLKELRRQQPEVQLRFWCDRSFRAQAGKIVAEFDSSIRIDTIVAGKLRRYHHLTFWQHITWFSLMFKNLLDIILVGFGIIQSFFKLLFWRPDVIFTKGGFVCLPVGVAAHILRIPLVIHDSDAHPGLTNRILSKWATKIATGAPLEYYNYPKSKTSYIGIPIHEDFKPSNLTQSAAAKAEWGVKPDFPLLVVTGGGLGATRINNSVLSALSSLQQYCSVVLVSGTGHFDELRALVPEDSETFKLHAFVSKMPSLLTAADVVATRAGATTILELAAAHKPTIVIPNAKLTGGHQVKNAKVYADAGAVLVVDEDGMLNDPQILVEAVRKLVVDTKLAGKMSEAFGKFAKPNAAKDMADIILSTVAK